MKITNLKQQVKRPERVSVFVDNKYSFSLSLDQLAELKIKNNQEVEESQLKQFIKISEDGKVKDRALAWLLNRPHSVREFRDYMRRKKVEEELSLELEGYFLGRKYLDDEHYAQWLIDMRSRGNKSNRAITSELYKKGISREVIEKVLQKDEDLELNRLKQVIEKKQKLGRYANDPAKLVRYLTSQGFSYSNIKQQLKFRIEEDS